METLDFILNEPITPKILLLVIILNLLFIYMKRIVKRLIKKIEDDTSID